MKIILILNLLTCGLFAGDLEDKAFFVFNKAEIEMVRLSGELRKVKDEQKFNEKKIVIESAYQKYLTAKNALRSMEIKAFEVDLFVPEVAVESAAKLDSIKMAYVNKTGDVIFWVKKPKSEQIYYSPLVSSYNVFYGKGGQYFQINGYLPKDGFIENDYHFDYGENKLPALFNFMSSDKKTIRIQCPIVGALPETPTPTYDYTNLPEKVVTDLEVNIKASKTVIHEYRERDYLFRYPVKVDGGTEEYEYVYIDHGLNSESHRFFWGKKNGMVELTLVQTKIDKMLDSDNVYQTLWGQDLIYVAKLGKWFFNSLVVSSKTKEMEYVNVEAEMLLGSNSNTLLESLGIEGVPVVNRTPCNPIPLNVMK